jgi:hypothetical protein
MIRDFLAGRMGVDSVAFVSISGALVLGQNLAGIVVASCTQAVICLKILQLHELSVTSGR